MKLLSFSVGGQATFGAVINDRIIDLGQGAGGTYADLRAAITAGALGDLEQAAANATGPTYGLDDVEYLPVIPNPDKILCVGLNYKSHVDEVGRELPKIPVVFTRLNESQVGHNQPIILPPESNQLDFECEIAVIIGKGGRRIAEADAASHIAGYAPYNDGSIRDWQLRALQWTPGKNFYHTGGFGPWMMTADELGDDPELTLSTRLNGVEVQRASSRDMIFSIPYLIAYLSSFIPLIPGDVLVTGTPGGVGVKREPQLWMKDGDICEVELQPIGLLRSPIKAELV